MKFMTIGFIILCTRNSHYLNFKLEHIFAEKKSCTSIRENMNYVTLINWKFPSCNQRKTNGTKLGMWQNQKAIFIILCN
jgi:hypothetical protein